MTNQPRTTHITVAVAIIFMALTTVGVLPTAQALDSDEAFELRQAIAAFSHEPDIYEVHQHVLSHRDIDDEDTDRWTHRARWSNLLPRVQGQASWLDQRNRQNRFREDIDADDEGQYERNRAQHLWRDDLRLRAIYSVRLDFDLAELVYSGDEMAIQREVRNRWNMRDDLINEVTELYFARRRHQLHLELFPDDDMERRLDRFLEIEALTARIDSMTGGWFQSKLEEDQ